MNIQSTLLINKGEYIFERKNNKELLNKSLKVKLIVDYMNASYTWIWLDKSLKDSSIEKETIKYMEDFANRMIASKSGRDFYNKTK